MFDGIMSRAVGAAQNAARQVTAPVLAVTLTRRGHDPVCLTGVVGLGETDAEIISDEEVITTKRMLDALIAAADYKIDGAAVLPQSGDVLSIQTDAETYYYEVNAESPEPAWRYSDPFKRQLRVHLKLKEAS